MLNDAPDANQQSPELLRRIINHTPVWVWAVDAAGKFIFSNGVGQQAPGDGGSGDGDVVGQSAFEVFDDSQVVALLRRALEGKQASDLVRNESSWHEVRISPLLDDAGNVEGAAGVHVEVTARQLAEERLHEQEQRYRSIVETAQEGIWSIDTEERITFVNRKMAEMLGYDVKDILGKRPFDFMDEEIADVVKASLALRREGIPDVMEVHINRKDGSLLWALVSATPIIDGKGQYQGASAMYADISVRKRSEMALQDSERRFRSLLEFAPVGIVIVNTHGVIEQVNARTEFLFGYDREEIVGQDAALLLPEGVLEQPGGDDGAANVPAPVMRSARDRDLIARRRDGSEFPVAIGLSPIELEGETLIMAYVEDITELREAERLKDAFINNVSHELRTPLTSLKLFQGLMRKASPDEFEQFMDVQRRETLRLESIIENVLLLTRFDKDETDPRIASVDLNEVVAEMVGDRAALASTKGHTLDLQAAPGPLAVKGDPNLLERVVSNLLTNALNFTPEGGHVTVKTLSRKSEGKDWAGFSVADDGPGIPRDELPHIFRRFYRGSITKNGEWPGTGLGLAVADEIVDRHEGRIGAESKGVPGEGTIVTVWLPAEE